MASVFGITYFGHSIQQIFRLLWQNISDPIQSLFLASVRASQHGGLDNASPAIKAELEAELERLAKQVKS